MFHVLMFFPCFMSRWDSFFFLGREGRSKVVIQQRARDAGLEAIGRDYRYFCSGHCRLSVM